MDIERNISMFLHCGECLKEFKAGDAPGESPRTYARFSLGFTLLGLQAVCTRHDLNVVHIDFEGQTHPADQSREGDFGGSYWARVEARQKAKAMDNETLTHGNRESWLSTVWDALDAWRNEYPEGEPANDSKWDEICTAMAWIREELGLPSEVERENDGE